MSSMMRKEGTTARRSSKGRGTCSLAEWLSNIILRDEDYQLDNSGLYKGHVRYWVDLRRQDLHPDRHWRYLLDDLGIKNSRNPPPEHQITLTAFNWYSNFFVILEHHVESGDPNDYLDRPNVEYATIHLRMALKIIFEEDEEYLRRYPSVLFDLEEWGVFTNDDQLKEDPITSFKEFHQPPFCDVDRNIKTMVEYWDDYSKSLEKKVGKFSDNRYWYQPLNTVCNGELVKNFAGIYVAPFDDDATGEFMGTYEQERQWIAWQLNQMHSNFENQPQAVDPMFREKFFRCWAIWTRAINPNNPKTIYVTVPLDTCPPPLSLLTYPTDQEQWLYDYPPYNPSPYETYTQEPQSPVEPTDSFQQSTNDYSVGFTGQYYDDVSQNWFL
ncbi:hypothetical protein ABW20_dc0109355 [Dactylellina cionopaga]|nr:hypothetical protein ABW20_dc0109355 [Dactylellina cionopaga]